MVGIRSRSSVMFATIVVGLAGCYLEHGRVDDASSDAGTDAGPRDAGPVDLGTGATPCVLQPPTQQAVPITTTYVEPILSSATVVDGEVWVSWQTNLSARVEGVGRQLAIINADSAATVRESHQVMSIPGGASYTIGNSIVEGSDGRIGFLGWDDQNGCRFESLTPAGDVEGEPVSVAREHCSMLRATAAGFTFFESTGFSEGGNVWLTHLNSAGSFQSRSEALPLLDSVRTWWSTAMDEDETYFTATTVVADHTTELVLGHMDGAGNTLAAFENLPVDTEFVGRIRLSIFGDAIVLAWSEPTNSGSPNGVDVLRSAAFSKEGRLLARSSAPLATIYRDAGFAMQVLHGHLYIAFVVDEEPGRAGAPERIELLELDVNGDAVAAPTIRTQNFTFVRDPMIRETPSGAIVLFDAPDEARALREIHALPLGCTPELDGDDNRTTH